MHALFTTDNSMFRKNMSQSLRRERLIETLEIMGEKGQGISVSKEMQILDRSNQATCFNRKRSREGRGRGRTSDDVREMSRRVPYFQ